MPARGGRIALGTALGAGAAAVLAPAAHAALSFSQQVHMLGKGTTGIAVGDFNELGGPLDIVVGYNGSTGAVPGVLPLFGDGTGSFFPRPSVIAGPQGFPVRSVAAGDVDGDGIDDVVGSAPTGDYLGIEYGQGAGNLLGNDVEPVATAPVASAVADLTRDGRSDIVVADCGAACGGSGSGGLRQLTQTGGQVPDLTYATSTLGKASSPVAVAVADLTGDDVLDVVATTTSGIYAVGRASAGGVTNDVTQLVQDPTGPLAVGDIDGDGKPDVLARVGGVKTGFAVARNTSTPASVAFAAPLMFRGSIDAGTYVHGLALADFDGDGRLDVALSYGANPAGVEIMLNRSTPGSPAFASAADIAIPASIHGGETVAAADFDGNGLADVAFSDIETLTVALNHSVGALTPDATAVDFGSVISGHAGPARRVTIANTGDGPVTIADVALAGADPDAWLLGGTDCVRRTLAAGASCTVDLRFLPQDAGARTATLRVTSTGPAAPLVVGLSGTGTSAPLATGPTGPTGPTGATGATGPQGPRGPAGTVTCAKVKVKAGRKTVTVTCRLVASAGRSRVSARISRAGRVRYSATGVRERSTARFHVAHLTPGRYDLTLRWVQDGRQRTATGTLVVR